MRVCVPATMVVTTALLAVALPARATYSPPLTRVRIDADRLTHTPELVLAFDRRDEDAVRVDAQIVGLQYILQIERAAGFGLQLGGAVGRASIELGQGPGIVLAGAGPDPSALFVGAQARFYGMLWSHPYAGRAHALTGFVNLRFAHYATLGDQALQVSSTALSAGVGAMAELVLGEYVSLCPYAWLSPGLYSHYAVEGLEPSVAQPGPTRLERDAGPGFRTPLQFGLDVWIYVLGAQSDQHLSLSLIASLIDTSANESRAIAGVVGWTF